MKFRKLKAFLSSAVSAAMIASTVIVPTLALAEVTPTKTLVIDFDDEAKKFSNVFFTSNPTDETGTDKVIRLGYMGEDGITDGPSYVGWKFEKYIVYDFDIYYDSFNTTKQQTYWRMVNGQELRGSEGSYTSGACWTGLGAISRAVDADGQTAYVVDGHGKYTGDTVNPKKWYSFRYVVDTSNFVIRAYYGEKGSELKPVSYAKGMSEQAWKYTDEYNANFSQKGYASVKISDDKKSYTYGDFATYTETFQFGRNEGTQGTENVYVNNFTVNTYDYLNEAVNNAQSAEEVKDVLDFYAETGAFKYGNSFAFVDSKDYVYEALIGKNFETCEAVQTAFDTAVAEYATSICAAMNNARSAEDVKNIIESYASNGSFNLATADELSYITDMDAFYASFVGRYYRSDDEVQRLYDSKVMQAKPGIKLSEFGSYNFEDGNKGFNNGTIDTDPTAEAYGFSDRSENHILNITSNSVYALSEPVTKGILEIKAQIFADYYNGTSDPEYINGADPRGDAKLGSYGIGVWGDKAGTTGTTKIGAIARSGNIISENGGWGETSFAKHKWYDVTYRIDLDTKCMTATYALPGEAPKDMVFQSAYLKDDGTTAQHISKYYYFDGLFWNNNKNGTLPDKIKQVTLSGISSKLDNYIDNFEVNVYKPFYVAVNGENNINKIKELINTYSALGQIDISKIGKLDMTPVYTDLAGSDMFTSNAQIQKMIDSYVEPYSKTELTHLYTDDNRLICGYGDITVGDFIESCTLSNGATAAAYEYDGVTLADTNSMAKAGIKIVVTAANGLTSETYVLGDAKYTEFAPLVSFETLSDGSVYFKAQAAVKSYVKDPKAYMIIAAAYDGNKMIDIDARTITVAAPGEASAAASILKKDKADITYKAIFVDSSFRPVKDDVKVDRTLEGKKVLSIGDSITGNYTPGYPGYISNILGTEWFNGGVGGTTLSLGSSGLNKYLSFTNVADMLTDDNYDFSETDTWAIDNKGISGPSLDHYKNTLKTVNLEETDYLTMLYGTNDYSQGARLDNAENKYDKTTIKGAARYGFEKLLAKNPDLKIIVAAPFYRDRRNNDANTGEDHLNSDENPNSIGLYVRDYSNAICEVCAEYNIPVYNLYDISDISRFNEYYYLSDGLHPTETGKQYLGGLFAQMLIENK